jgi:hypothetical protein
LIEELHPGCQILVAFDNSMTHHAKSPDGLDVYRLKLSDGMASTANSVFMKPGWYLNAHGTRIEQTMQDANGIQKGVRTILREREKFQFLGGHDLNSQCHPCKIRSPRDDLDYVRSETCCASYVLSQEPDFKAQVEWLTEVVQAADFDIIFYPKYHCELNYIEMVWAWVKSHHRRNCTYTFKDLEQDLPKTLTELMPLSFVRKAFTHCLPFMSEYRLGLEGPLLDFSMKKYTSHGSIPDGVTDYLKTQYEAFLLNKKSKK